MDDKNHKPTEKQQNLTFTKEKQPLTYHAKESIA